MHIKVSCLHRFDIDGHGSCSARPLEDSVLTEEARLILFTVRTQPTTFLFDGLGVAPVDVPLDDDDGNDGKQTKHHITLEDAVIVVGIRQVVCLVD